MQPDLVALGALLAASDKVVVLADGADVVPRLGTSLPVAIAAEGWEEAAEQLDDIFLGDAELWCVVVGCGALVWFGGGG